MAASGVDISTISVTIEGTTYTNGSGLTITGTPADYTVSFTNSTDWNYGQVVNVSINAKDLAGNSMPTKNYSFTVEFQEEPTTKKTKTQLLEYYQTLGNLETGAAKQLISGQRVNHLSESDALSEFTEIAAKTGGIVPAIMGYDFSLWYPLTDSYEDFNVLINHWNSGGLVHFTWHCANPATVPFEWSWPLNTPSFTFSDIYTPGNTRYNNFRSALVRVGDKIQELKNAGVVITFAPFHEANIDAFWWNNRTPTEYSNAWHYVYNYLVNERGLGDNIIWVYTVCPYDDPALYYYPGDDVVDVLGLDVYAARFNTSAMISYYNTLCTKGKPVAITELGFVSGTTYTGFDARYIVNDLCTYFPKAVWWMNWDDEANPYGIANQNYVLELMSDQRVVTLLDNPSDGAGQGDVEVVIVEEALPVADIGIDYSYTFQATGGQSPYYWSLYSGDLPTGLVLTQNGNLSGRASGSTGNFVFTVEVADSSNAVVFDDFNRENTIPLSGNGWVQDSANDINLVDNQVLSTETILNAYAWRTETYNSNQYSKIKIKNSSWSVELGGPIVRFRQSGSVLIGYLATVIDSSTIEVYALYGTTVQQYEQLGTSITGLTLAQNDIIGLSVDGNVLTLTQNGNVIGTRTDTNNRVPSSGAPGFMICGTTARFDDWEGGNLGQSNSDTAEFTLTVRDPIYGDSITINPTADTFINSGSPTTNYSSNTYLAIYQWPDYTIANQVLLQFDLSSIPSNKNILSSKLRLYMNGFEGYGGTNPVLIYAYRITGTLPTISTVTWNTFEGTLSSALGSTSVSLSNGWVEIDVTSAVDAAYSDEVTYIYFAVDAGSNGVADTNRRFSSNESSDSSVKPQLLVTYENQITEIDKMMLPPFHVYIA
jgi:mannan endo-1,4-beta-mannosidase